MSELNYGFIRVQQTVPFDLSVATGVWLFSRPQLSGVSERQVAGTDLPVLDFPRAVFEVAVPALLREWLVTFRNHIFWSRSSRVDDVTGFAIYYQDLKINGEDLRENHRHMLEMKAAGVHQDRFRGLMPMSYMAQFSMTLSLRDYFHLLNAVQREIEQRIELPSQHSLLQMFLEFSSSLYYAVPKEIQEHYARFPHQSLPSGAGVEPGEASGRFGGFVYGRSLMSLMLRAQLARHRHIGIRDNLRSELAAFLQPGCVITQDDQLWVEWSMSLEAARSILGKRQCWIAHEDLWEPLLRPLAAALGDDPMAPTLPCNGGTCPFQLDIRARLEGRDPAPPCPLYAERWGGGFLEQPQRAAAEAYRASHKPITGGFWQERLNALEPFKP
jgi:hypothetical protein